jgi:hypothetical protein
MAPNFGRERSSPLVVSMESKFSLDLRRLSVSADIEHIERLIGTMMGAVHVLPGTTFTNVKIRGDFDAEGRATTFTLRELEKMNVDRDRWEISYALGVGARNRPR